MSDPLRDAAARLRGLKEDVERLKSGRREEGVLRLLRQLIDDTTVDDVVETGPAASVHEETTTSDDVATGADASTSDATTSDDAAATFTSSIEPAAWDEGGWDEDAWS
jgi:hypothetical protein